MTFEPEGAITLVNATLDVTVMGTYAQPDSTHVEIRSEAPTPRFPDQLTLTVLEWGEDWVRLEGPDDEAWDLVRYQPLPSELTGRWLTLPRNDPRYFIELTAPNDVLWRRRFGMKRSEDRVGRGWMRGDSLFLHIWGSPPMHYVYEISGDTLAFERPGIGPFGRYVKAP